MFCMYIMGLRIRILQIFLPISMIRVASFINPITPLVGLRVDTHDILMEWISMTIMGTDTSKEVI